MPRPPRVEEPGTIYHVTNRWNGRLTLFRTDGDFAAFERVLGEGLARYPVDLLTYCLMGNHWHLVVVPRAAGALADLMRWVGVTHVRRHHAAHRTRGGGHLYQGRYKSFPVQCDRHLLLVLRYVEANALRAGLVASARHWPWGGLHARAAGGKPFALADWPLDRPADWPDVVDAALEPEQLARLRRDHVHRGRPRGTAAWTADAVRRLGLTSTVRPVGRPRKAGDNE
jgi:putative transposase